MAHLLGGQFCIESLRKDVTDVQSAITDVFSRAGPAVHPSWKYPDKKSNEINIVELLEFYDHSEDVEDNQVAHIVLLELVVDRLVLLLQAMAKFVEQTLSMGSRKASAVQSSSNTSIGLVVKKYWNKIVQVYTVVQQLQSEAKTKAKLIDEQENKIRVLEQELQQYKTGVGSPSFSPLESQKYSLVPGNSVSRVEIARDESSRPSQTVETAFVPCEACHRVQHCLKEVGTNMNRICDSQQLPCSLKKFQAQMDMDWMTANDIGRWCTEQNKDLARINKHFDYLLGTIDPLKHDLEAERKKTEDLEKRLEHALKEMKSEKNTQTIMQKQFQIKLKEVERQGMDSVNKIQQQKKILEREKEQLENQLKILKGELERHQVMFQRLETTKTHLEDELHDSKTNNEQVNVLQSEVKNLKEQVSATKKKLKENERELAKEKAKAQSLSLHSESVQGKQGSMLQRIDDLDRENEKLRDEMADLEEIKEQLEERLDRAEERRNDIEKQCRKQKVLADNMIKDKESIESSIQELHENIANLEEQICKAKENEKLLIMYPDLNGPVNPDISGTGDIVIDMENQVKANTMRITILEEQNNTLRNSVAKVIQTQKCGPKEILSTPIPLWRPRSPDDGLTEACPSEASIKFVTAQEETSKHEQQRLASTQKPKTRSAPSKPKTENVRQSFTIGKSPMLGSASKKSRPQSGSSFHAYMRLKNSGMMKAVRDPPATKAKPSDYVLEDVFSCQGSGGNQRNPASQLGRNGGMDYRRQDVFTCGKCDKVYNSKRDLEIHNTYCYGGL